MVLDLPPPITDKLARSPLSLVVCQVRHDWNPAVNDSDVAREMYDALKDAYPNFDQNSTQDLSLVVGPNGLQAMPGEGSRGWRFRSPDHSWTVVVMPDSFALETTNYADWADFKGRLAVVTTAVERTLRPAIEARIGVRYIDRLTDLAVTEPTGWAGKIHPALLGAIGHPGLAPGVVNTQSIVQLRGAEDVQVLLRYGCVLEPTLPSGTWTYLLDHDCFRDGSRPFNSKQVLDRAEVIHTTALQVFQAALTDGYLSELLKGA